MKFRWWVVISVGLFAIGLIAGLAVPTGLVSEIIEESLAALDDLGDTIEPFSVSTAVFILAKNIIALVISFALSPILCLMPLFTLLLNGALIGVISSLVIEQEGILFLLAGILPHGILELPGLFIGEAAAFSFGAIILAAIFFPSTRPTFAVNIKRSLRFLALACILMIPAAFIEAFLTPLLLQ